VILSISSTTIILKTFEELGVKAKICGNSDWFPHCSGYCSHINDGSIIYRSKSTIFRNRVSVVRAETDFLPNNLVCQRDIFHSYPTQKTKHLTDEMMLIISLALCLMMVILASNVGFSPALGAFIMGSIIAETTQAEHIEHLKPVKDLFGAIFSYQ
jgi:CPA2 family monovalent cation:H+ antiporter-2